MDQNEMIQEGIGHYDLPNKPAHGIEHIPRAPIGIPVDNVQLPTPSLTSHPTVTHISPDQSLSTQQQSINDSDQARIVNTENGVSGLGTNSTTASTSSNKSTKQSLDSLAKLRQFKAELLAKKHDKNTKSTDQNNDIEPTEVNSSALAKMAEMFLLQQQQKNKSVYGTSTMDHTPLTGTKDSTKSSPSTMNTTKDQIKDDSEKDKIKREQELREKLKSRSSYSNQGTKSGSNSRDQSPAIGVKREMMDIRSQISSGKGDHDNQDESKRRKIDQTTTVVVDKSRVQTPVLPANPPWDNRAKSARSAPPPIPLQSSPNTSSASLRSNQHQHQNQPPHSNDPRFTRRDISTTSSSSSLSHSTDVKPQAGSDYRPTETNFVPVRFQNQPRSSEQDKHYRRRSRSPPARIAEPRQPFTSNHTRTEGRILADRIAGMGATPQNRLRSRSPPRRSSASHQRQITPPRSRDYPRAASPPQRYPDPRTPATPAFPPPGPPRRPDEFGQHVYDHQRPAPGTRKDNAPDPYRRVASPVRRRTPPPPLPPPLHHGREYERDPRYPHDPRGDPYTRNAYPGLPPPEYQRHTDDRYDRPPHPPHPLAPPVSSFPTAGIDTDNVVETLEALKAQISKLEKLVPASLTSHPAPPPPPPQHGSGPVYHEGRYDPYEDYARRYNTGRPRSPHPREREYVARAVQHHQQQPCTPLPPSHLPPAGSGGDNMTRRERTRSPVKARYTDDPRDHGGRGYGHPRPRSPPPEPPRGPPHHEHGPPGGGLGRLGKGGRGGHGRGGGGGGRRGKKARRGGR
ncbi:uncharacterized protein L201_007692 [Kwoniella dendrophila CBS 6074]|uniref:Uncharacterized protein n=1 Tax=Kwoniella dendrophila CBS 6074 TaxID=1295534 RepID=A0AAX4K6K6_9TREE